MDIFTNTTKNHDFFLNLFLKYGEECDVYIASAFFTHDRIISELVGKKCRVFLIVRLGHPTSYRALKSLLFKSEVQIRFYTDKSFHPKIYIFGNKIASVGSSNLTDGGLTTNQEVNLTVTPENPIFQDIRDLFSDYWEQASVLDSRILEDYKLIENKYHQIFTMESQLEQNIRERIGRVVFDNVRRGLKKPKASNIYLEGYKKDYQVFLSAYTTIRQAYEKLGKRKIDESQLPLRIEIDQFFNWVREEKAQGDSYERSPYRHGHELTDFITGNINEYIEADWSYLDAISQKKYPLIIKVLGSVDSINNATEQDIIDALLVVHAFHDCFRFHLGGEKSLIRNFLSNNELDKIKSILVYLLHNKDDDYITRMGNCIYNPDLKLKYFGDSCVQETLGWVNHENIPICNDRTLKSIRWLGFRVRI